MGQLIQLFNSANEFMEEGGKDIALDLSHNKRIIGETDNCGENGFHGNRVKILDKFRSHDLKAEAKIISSALDDINAADFSEAKWQFCRAMEEGDAVDINRYLDGADRFWMGVKRSQTTRKVVRVYCQFGGNSSRTASELAISGAIGVTIAEILESFGVGVELWGVSRTCNVADCTDLNTYVKIKEANEFADLGTINYILGNSHVFRCICFRNWVSILDRNKRDSYSGLGQTSTITAENMGLPDEEVASAVIIPDIYTRDEAIAWLKQAIVDAAKKAR